MNLLLGILYGLIAQAFTFIQLQGQFKIDWMKHNIIWVMCMGMPISFLYLMSVKYLVDYFEGQLWPSRLLGFAIGAVVFTIMSYWWFQEPLSLKTLICLGLALSIMVVQLSMK